MARRYAKKKLKWRGQKTHGCGNIKNRRGKGNKGGKGRAGKGKHNKHKWTYVVVYERDNIGKRGFVPQDAAPTMKTINIWELNSMAKAGKLQKENDMYVFEFGGKVLGSGAPLYPFKVKAGAISAKAKARIEAKGGVVESDPISAKAKARMEAKGAAVKRGTKTQRGRVSR